MTSAATTTRVWRIYPAIVGPILQTAKTGEPYAVPVPRGYRPAQLQRFAGPVHHAPPSRAAAQDSDPAHPSAACLGGTQTPERMTPHALGLSGHSRESALFRRRHPCVGVAAWPPDIP